MTDSLPAAGLVSALRAQAGRYHDRHPFHQKMNAGGLSPEQIRGWAANRFNHGKESRRSRDIIMAASRPMKLQSCTPNAQRKVFHSMTW